VKGFDEKFVFHGVHMLFDGNFMGEWAEGQERVSKFVFIGKDLDRQELEAGFRACVAPKLRFKIGDTVESKIQATPENPTGWAKGVIMREWQNGNPYRIKIEKTGKEVRLNYIILNIASAVC